jgi:hypothetical protein
MITQYGGEVAHPGRSWYNAREVLPGPQCDGIMQDSYYAGCDGIMQDSYYAFRAARLCHSTGQLLLEQHCYCTLHSSYSQSRNVMLRQL